MGKTSRPKNKKIAKPVVAAKSTDVAVEQSAFITFCKNNA